MSPRVLGEGGTSPAFGGCEGQPPKSWPVRPAATNSGRPEPAGLRPLAVPAVPGTAPAGDVREAAAGTPHRPRPEPRGARRAVRGQRVQHLPHGAGGAAPVARDAAEAGPCPRRRARRAASREDTRGLTVPAREMLLHLARVLC